ncbi:MAG TPA: hypothetical protein DEF51_24125 [Myxococcales bacterium]|nr:hypothetical protein [Myxococcales bacterium]
MAAFALFSTLFCAVAPTQAHAQLVLWMDARPAHVEALEDELAGAGFDVAQVLPPKATTPEARREEARRLARATRAEIALWQEPDGALHAVGPHGARADAPMPIHADARVAAIVAARLVDVVSAGAHRGHALGEPRLTPPPPEPREVPLGRGPLSGPFFELGWSSALMAHMGLLGAGFFPHEHVRLDARIRGGAVFTPISRGAFMSTGGVSYAADRRQGRFEFGVEGGYGFLGADNDAEGHHMGVLGASFGFSFTTRQIELSVRFTAYLGSDGDLTVPFGLGDLVVRVFP